MVTTRLYFPVLGEGADKLAKWIHEMSNGRLKISVYGGGELVPPLGVFDAVSKGTVEMVTVFIIGKPGKFPQPSFLQQALSLA